MDPNKRKPGWYPDPGGDLKLQRWWGPADWSSETRPSVSAGRPAPAPRNPEQANVVIGFAMFAVIGALVIWGIVSLITGGDDKPEAAPQETSVATTAAPTKNAAPTAGSENDGTAKKACQESVKNQLKDPDSAKFRNLQVVDMTTYEWSIVGEVNANNSFGGKTGYFPFSCSATMRDSDTVNAVATLIEPQ